MFKYALLVVLNTPFIVLGVARAYESYKNGRSGRGRYAASLIFWTFIAAGLIFALPFYEFLQSKNLTDSSPLSLFDVIEITGINLLITMALRLYTKFDNLEQKLARLNQEISIELSKNK